MPRFLPPLIAAITLLGALGPAAAQAPPGALTGDWWGVRPALFERGLRIDTFVIAEGFATLDGGVRRDATFLDAVDVRVVLDGERLFGWSGLTVLADALGTHGGHPSAFVGDAQGVSEIAGPSRWRLQEGWVQQSLFGGRVSLLAGRYDLGTEFYLLPAATVLINSSFGAGPEFTESGRRGPSVFPDTTVGGRLEVRPLAALALRTAVFSGFVIGEIAWMPDEGKVAIGGWGYTGTLDDLSRVARDGSPVRHHGSAGAYLIAEQTIHHLGGDPARRVTIFGQLGVGDPRVSRYAVYTGGGLVVAGPWAARGQDQVALGVAAAHNGDQYRQQQRREGLRAERSEVTVELTYRAQVAPWLFVQPDVQLVINPDTDPARANAVVGGVRLTAAF
jgi:porin